MVLSKISPSFNVAIPKEIHLAINLQPGDTLEFYLQEDGSIVLRKEVALDHNDSQIGALAIEVEYEDEDGEEEEEEEIDDDEDECSSCLNSERNAYHQPEIR